MPGDGVGELFAIGDALGVQLGHPELISLAGAITADQRGQFRGAGQPGRCGHSGREHPGAQMRDGHHIPFQPLGRMHGQNLHPARACGHFHRREAFFDLPRSVQVLQERGDHPDRIALVGGLGESRRNVGESAQLIQALTASPCDKLDVQGEHSLHLGDQVGERHPESRAQRRQFPSQCGQALPALRRVFIGRTGIADGIGQTRNIGFLSHVWADRRRAAATESRRPPPQHHQIVGAKTPPGSGQHAQGGGASGRVGDKTQHSHGVGDLRKSEQTGKSDHLGRNTLGGKSLGHGRGVTVSPDQHRRRRRAVPLAMCLLIYRGQLRCDPFSLGSDVAQQCARDTPGGGVRPGQQRPDGHRTPTRLLRDRVGQVQGLGWVAPAGTQFPGRRR
ncbi:Uncharacterised protein [Mycobacteroides abscessus subsp. abscessus]|nr:Uncharacterised protein [Mycobacteroides abscessus subsp. abscessus]SHR31311.1 Uncharacterised protein [Mycobacteroides abscessus subsp. abscessus]